METKYFLLGTSETSTIIKIIRIFFGLACIIIAIFWMIFSIRSVGSDRTIWISVLFLSAFGIYQLWAGFGQASRFIEIGNDKIILKKSSFLPLKQIQASDIKRKDVFPLSLIFYLRDGGKTTLRFGTTYTDNIVPVMNEIEQFASANHIDLERIAEEI